MTAVVDAAEAPTPERLLDAAERLFAHRGIRSVSVRAVNAAAGTNVAAVHYHFGSKDALVEAVLRRRMDALGRRRLAMLAALPTATPPPVRTVVEALVEPLAELSADPASSGRAYVQVLAALQADGPEAQALLTGAFAPQFGPFDDALARSLPALREPVRHFRLGLVGRLVLQTLAAPEAAAATLGLDPGDHPGVVAALIDTATGALDAPVAPSRKGSRP